MELLVYIITSEISAQEKTFLSYSINKIWRRARIVSIRKGFSLIRQKTFPPFFFSVLRIDYETWALSTPYKEAE
jgi:hypothetical protein